MTIVKRLTLLLALLPALAAGQTTLVWRSDTQTGLHHTHWSVWTAPHGDRWWEAPSMPFSGTSVSHHIHWVNGETACLFTEDSQGRPGASGRTMNAQNKSAYIQYGWDVYAIAGGDCRHFGIDECWGICR